MSAKKGIAVFDFDGTLTTADSFLAFIKFVRGWRAFLWGFLLHLPSIFKYFAGQVKNDELKRIIFSHFFADIPAHELEKLGRQFSLDWIPSVLLQGAKDRLAWHESQAHEIIILSASSDLWLGAWCKEQGYDLISTQFAVVDNHYDGQIVGENCYGLEKERRILPYISKYPKEARYGYGDRKSDQAYLQHCGYANHLPLLSGLAPFLYRTNQQWSPLLYRLLSVLSILLFVSLPFSIGIDFNAGMHQINLPSEPILGVLTLLSLTWFLLHGFWSRSFYLAPIGLAGLVFISIMLVTSLTSTIPWVSFKYSLIAGVHWWVFFHMLPLFFDHKASRLTAVFRTYVLGFLLILAYAWYQHSQYGFRIDASVLTARPFYFDHALYSCCALLLLGFIYPSISLSKHKLKQATFGICGLLLLVGLYLSFSRAAWLSAVLAGIGALIVWIFRLRLKHLLVLSIIGGSSILLLTLQLPANENKIQSNASTAKNPIEHLSSILNTNNNVSNLERLNRYSCAWRMFKDRPIHGFGPGTYERQYLSYQREDDMTTISVTEFGRHRPGMGGGAHSEYLQALSESGILGLLSWVLLILAFLFTSLELIRLGSTWEMTLALGSFFGLSTYFIHGVFNNFLHHDKIAALVWGGLAVLQFLYQSSQRTQAKE